MVCTMIDVIILTIHGTPYFEIFLWLSRPRRFPSGIWFEIVSCSRDCQGSAYLSEAGLLKNPQPKEDKKTKTKNIIVSVLHDNYLSIGDLVLPHYKEVFSVVSGFVITSAQGALMGKRTASRLDAKLLSTLPWVFIPSRSTGPSATVQLCSVCHNI